MLRSLIGNAKGRCGSTESRLDGGVSTVINRKRCAGSVSASRLIIRNFAVISLIAFSLFSCNFGKGKLDIEVIWPDKTLVKPVLSVTAQMTGGKAEEYTNQNGQEIVISSVEAGSYTLILRLKDGETVVWEKTISCVVDGGITTKIKYTITENDFTDFALYRPDIIVTELGEDRYRIEIVSVNYKGEIRYTMTNPAEDPTSSSAKYTGAFEIDYTAEQGKVITARVFYKEYNPSEPAVLHLTKVETPVLQDTTSHRLNDTLTFSVISPDTEAKYYYTLDGSIPNAVSPQTNGIIEMAQPAKLTVKGFKDTYLMSDSVELTVERLARPIFGEITENDDGTTYTISIQYGEHSEAMFLTNNKDSVIPDNCPIGSEITLPASLEYTITDLNPKQTIKTRSVAVNYFASEEAVLESQQAADPQIIDARAGNRSWTEALAVIFGTSDIGAKLHYTFDGTDPTKDSPSTDSGISVSVPESTNTVSVRSYVPGKFPSVVVSVSVAKATSPGTVSLDYWNQLKIDENPSVSEAEKETRILFYRLAATDSWSVFEENTVYLEGASETTVEAIGGSEFCFPSDSVKTTFSVLSKPTVTDSRTGSNAAYLNPLQVELASDNGNPEDAVKYYYTTNGNDPTRTSSTAADNPTAVSIGTTETLKAVATGLNRMTSEISDPVDGTPLNPPKLSVDDTGTVTITAAAADADVPNIVFFYKIGDEAAFSPTAAGTEYNDGAKPQLTADQTLYAVAAAPMRNPSDKATLTLTQSEPPTITDGREASEQYYLDLSLLVTGKTGDALFYALGADAAAVDTPALPYNDPVSPSKGTDNWIGAAAKADSELKSETVKQQLFTFADSPRLGDMKHDVTSNRFNLVTITAPAAPGGSGLSPVSVFYTLEPDFTVQEKVSLYTEEFEAVSPADAAGSVTVSAIAGGRFCYPTDTVTKTYDQTAQPSVTDARGTAIYKTLKVTVTPNGSDTAATVYSSVNGTAWSAVANPVTVQPEETYRFMAAAAGKVTSAITEVDGTRLNPPTLTINGDGSITVTPAADNGGTDFYYIVTSNDTADFENGTATQVSGNTIPAGTISGDQNLFVVAAAIMKNPSEPVSPNQQAKSDPPTITDARSADTYYRTLQLEIQGTGSLFYALGSAENAVTNPTNPYNALLTPINESWVGAAAQEEGKRKSDPVTQELKSFTAIPSVTLTHDKNNQQFNILNITLNNTNITSPTLYYSTDDTFTANVQKFITATPLPDLILNMIGNTSVTIYAKAGAEFAYPSQTGQGTFNRSTAPTVTDARSNDYYKELQVSCNTEVYYSTDGSSWTQIAMNTITTVSTTETGSFKVVEDGKITSPVTEVPGTPLDAPTVTVDSATGAVTVTAGSGTNSGTVFYYVINDGASVDFNTATGITQYQSASQPNLDAGKTIHVVAGKELRNPSSVVSTSRDTQTPPDKPVVIDARTTQPPAPNSYFNPSNGTTGTITLNVSQAANIPVYYLNGGNEVQVTGGSVTVASNQTGTYVFYAKDTTGQKSEEVTVEVKKLAAPQFQYSTTPPSASLTSSDGADILYELANPRQDVTASSQVYSGFTLTDLPGKTVTAVAVKEFCFSSSQTEQDIPVVPPPQPSKPNPPTVTDSRTNSGSAGEYFAPRPDTGSITLIITPADTADAVYYKKGTDGTETQITGNQLSIGRDEAGTYIFYSMANGLSSNEVTVDVKVLAQPILTENGGRATLTSPDSARILYTAQADAFGSVTETSPEYQAGSDLSGQYVSAVAVKEFCFSSGELQQKVEAPTPDPVTITFQNADGDTLTNGTYREAQTVTIAVTPPDATVTYSIGDQTYNQSYTQPISIDTNSDIYVQAVKDGETATAVLKIRLKCPNPTPQLTVSTVDPNQYELTFPGFDTSTYTIKTATETSDNTGTDYTAPMYLSPNETIIVFATKDGWMNSDKILVSVPEILKKKGLSNQ